jgi:hypothetical protein
MSTEAADYKAALVRWREERLAHLQSQLLSLIGRLN